MSALNYCYLLEKIDAAKFSDRDSRITEYIQMDKAYSSLQSRLGISTDDEKFSSKFQEIKQNIYHVIRLLLEINPYCLITEDLQKLKRYEQILLDPEVQKETVDEVLNAMVIVFRKYNEE